MNEATREFIRQHGQDDIRELALRGTKDPEVDLAFALQQIDGHRRAQDKLPSWAAVEGIVWPPHLSMEQCSSERTARYKAQVAGKGQLFVDLTAGFGVDTAFIAQGFKSAVCVELQPELCAISSANFQLLGLPQIEVVNGNGVEYLHAMPPVDLIFIDPARRDEHGGRTYGIADCTPNVLEIIDELLTKAQRVMIKLSPMLDWRKAVEDIGKEHVEAVHIVSVNNECKELLVEVMFSRKENSALPLATEGTQESGMRKEICNEAKRIKVVCVNLLSDGSEERFEFDAHRSSASFHSFTFSSFHFLYEPNASVMKAGCFDLLAERFGVKPLHQNSHLFVSDKEVTDFPGRGFVIERTTSMNKRELKESLVGVTQANIAVRNFPQSVADLRKRLKLQDGGDTYIFATTVENMGHRLLICRKIS